MFLWVLFACDLSTNKMRTKKIYLNVTSFYNHTLKCVQQALHAHYACRSNLIKSIKVCYYHLASESIYKVPLQVLIVQMLNQWRSQEWKAGGQVTLLLPCSFPSSMVSKILGGAVGRLHGVLGSRGAGAPSAPPQIRPCVECHALTMKPVTVSNYIANQQPVYDLVSIVQEIYRTELKDNHLR